MAMSKRITTVFSCILALLLVSSIMINVANATNDNDTRRIDYDPIRRGDLPGNPRHTNPRQPANNYTRGCSETTRCRHDKP